MERSEYKGSRGKGVRVGMTRAQTKPYHPLLTPNATISVPHSPSLTPNATLPGPHSQPLTPSSSFSTPHSAVPSPTSISPTPNSTLPTNELLSTPPNFQTLVNTTDEHPSIQRGARGENLSKNIPRNPEDRKVIHIQGSNYLEQRAVRAITKNFKSHFSGKETQWHLLDDNLVELLYKSFQDRYQYEETVDPKLARSVWEERSQIRFRGLWATVRKKCHETTGSSNPGDWRQCRPKFVHQNDWDGILASWMTDKWKKQSSVGAENRKKVPGVEAGTSPYVRHTGGSINFGIHRQRLETDLNRKVTEIEFFEKLHKKEKGNGEWCDVKSENVATKYKDVVKQKHALADSEVNDGVDPLHDVPFDPQAWIEATGVPKKNKVYGFGIMQEANIILDQTNCSNSRKRPRKYTSPDVNIEARIEAEVQARTESEVNKKLKIEMEAFKLTMMQQVQEQVKELMAGRQSSMSSSDSLGLDEDNP